MSEKQQEVSVGVMVGVAKVGDGERVALHVIAGAVNTTVVLHDRYALSLFDSLGATLESLGLLDDDLPGGVKCHH